MASVGTVSALLTADAAGFEAGIDRGFNALTKLSRGSTEAAASLTRTSQAAQQASVQAQSLAKTANTAKEGMSRLAGGLGQMSAAMGAAGGASQQLVNGLSGVLGVVGSGGGLLGAGLVAVAIASQLATKALKDQEEQAKATDAAWEKLWATSNKLRDANEKARAGLSGRLELEQLKTGDASSDNITAMQWAAAKRLEAAETERLRVTEKIEAIGSSLVGMSGAELEKRQENLAVLKAQRAVAEGAARDARTEFELASKVGAELERQARAAKARAEWEAQALRAQQELDDLLRDRAASAAVAGMMPNGGQLQAGAFTASAGSVAPAFAQLSTAGFSLDLERPDGVASAFEDAGGKLREVTGELSSFALNLPAATSGLSGLELQAQRAASELAGTAASIGNYIMAFASGSGGQAAGSALGAELGGIVGALVGGLTTGDAISGGAIGETIGASLGSILGGTLDSLIEALGVLTPIFDALGVVIKALSPILLVLRILAVDLGHTIESLAPVIHALAEPIAMLLLVVVRIVEVLLPMVDAILLIVGAILVLLEVITAGVDLLDRAFFTPLVQLARWLYNGFVEILNGLTEWIRDWTGNEDAGLILDKIDQTPSSPYDDFATSMDELRGYGAEADDIEDAVRGGAEEGVKAGLQRSFQNLPGGYKGFNNVEFGAAERSLGPVTIHIGQWLSRGGVDEDVARLRAYARNGTIARSLSRRGLPDRKN